MVSYMKGTQKKVKKCNVIETNCWDSRSIFSLHRLKMSTIVLPTPHQKKRFLWESTKAAKTGVLKQGTRASCNIVHLLSTIYFLSYIIIYWLLHGGIRY